MLFYAFLMSDTKIKNLEIRKANFEVKKKKKTAAFFCCPTGIKTIWGC